MAEVGIAASLIGITGAAINLARTLYVFGSTTSAAREQVEYIGKNVSFYSDVLELLVEQFEHDRPIHSMKAIALAEKLHDHSHDLFGRIRDLIPDGRRTRDQISFLQKIAWNFKKTKVDLLVGELENLKSTVQLLVQVLCAARQIHAYEADCGKSNEKKKNKKKREAVTRQCRRAENVIVEWQRAQENLMTLQDAAERSDLLSIQPGRESEQSEKPLRSKDAGVLIRGNETTLAVIEATAAAAGGSESDKRALVLKNTTDWLEKLIHEWTVPPSLEPVESVNETGLSESEDIARAQSKSSVNAETTDEREAAKGEASTDEQTDSSKDKVSVEVLEARVRLQEMELQEHRRYRWQLEQERDLLRSKQPAMGSSETSKLSEATPRTFHFSTDPSTDPSTGFSVADPSDRYASFAKAGSAFGEDVYGARGESAEANPKGNAVPNQGADLKHAETYDSGYGESGGKPKPELPREVVKEKAREKEAHASNAKSRDPEQRRERMDKQSSRRPYVEDDCSSDSDTVNYASINRLPRTSKSAYDSVPRTKPKPELPRGNTSRREEDEDEKEDKWHSIHGSAREFIERWQRPGISGRISSSRSYWESPDDQQSGQKSGSDSDKRPRSSKGRRPSIDVPNTRPPAIPSHNSAPAGVATMKSQLEKEGSRSKQRSSTGGTSSRSSPKEVRRIPRSQTMPSLKPRKGDAMPVRSSNLKHAETHDSGYGSFGGQTPDLSGTSPLRQGPIRYQVVEDDDDVSTILVDPEDYHPRTPGPSPPTRERDRRDRPQRPTVSTTDSLLDILEECHISNHPSR